MASIALAFAFFTRLPVGRLVAGGGATGQEREAERLRSAIGWFPLVGVVVGLAVAGTHVALAAVAPSSVAAAVAVTVGLAITGAFHEDGLGDTADGFGGGWTAAQRLEIMADPRQGTYGVVAIACSIVVRVAAISALTGIEAIVLVVAAHVLARAAAGSTLGLVRPAKEDGLARSVAGPDRRVPIAVGVAWAALAALAVGAQFGAGAVAILLTVAVIAAAGVIRLALVKIGGMSGDVLGAVEQVVEAATLVTAAAIVTGTATG